MSVNLKQIEKLVKCLRKSAMPSDDLVNIYHKDHDPDGWRCERLLRWLSIDRQCCVVLVGMCPGYNGAAVTGIPFTSIETLRNPEYRRLNELADIGEFQVPFGGKVPEKEPSARRLWKAAYPMFPADSIPITWNVLPFWSWERGKRGYKNRKPLERDFEVGRKFLTAFTDIFADCCFIALGNDAHRELKKVGIESLKVRHPSFPHLDKHNEFEKGLSAAASQQCQGQRPPCGSD